MQPCKTLIRQMSQTVWLSKLPKILAGRDFSDAHRIYKSTDLVAENQATRSFEHQRNMAITKTKILLLAASAGSALLVGVVWRSFSSRRRNSESQEDGKLTPCVSVSKCAWEMCARWPFSKIFFAKLRAYLRALTFHIRCRTRCAWGGPRTAR